MSTVKEIESAIRQLDQQSLSELSGWFDQHVARKLERRFGKIMAALPSDPITPRIEQQIERGVRSARLAHKGKPARK